MKFANILTRLTGQPWFITEDALVSLTDLLASRMALADYRVPGLPLPAVAPDGEEDEPLPAQVPGVARIPIHGVLGNHLSLMEQSCGGVDFGALVEKVRAAAYDPNVAKLLLHFQVCPGGTANGCPETFAALRSLRAESGKPFVALITGVCCSAGYYLAATCDSIVATESAMTGSIGAMRMVMDQSEAMAKAGVKRFAIKSARMKDIGNPDRPATAEELGVLQGMADHLGGMFKRDMQAARPGIAAEVFDTALPYYATEALKLGLIDGLVPDENSLLASLADSVAAPA